MTDPVSPPPPDAGDAADVATPAGRFKRLGDKIFGGPPKPENLVGKPWYRNYVTTLVMVAMVMVLWILPGIVDAINGLPDPAALEQRMVRIVATHEREPHLVVEDADGKRRGMEWPIRIPGSRSGQRSNIWSDEERKALPGCEAIVRGEPLRYTLNAGYRIWTLDCPDKQIHIGFDRSRKEYLYLASTATFSFGWLSLIGWGVWLLLVVIAFLKDRRGN